MTALPLANGANTANCLRKKKKKKANPNVLSVFYWFSSQIQKYMIHIERSSKTITNYWMISPAQANLLGSQSLWLNALQGMSLKW